jgi:excisionase family DNA binding protein
MSELPNKPLPPPLLLTVGEAAYLLRVGRSTLYAMIARGEVPFILCGKVRRIPIAALEQWIARQLEQLDGETSGV